MINETSEHSTDESGFIEVGAFSLNDPYFITKYGLLSGVWSRLVQLRETIICINDDKIFLRFFTYGKEDEVLLKNYLNEINHVFADK